MLLRMFVFPYIKSSIVFFLGYALYLKPVFHYADFSVRSGAAVVIALFISNNGHV